MRFTKRSRQTAAPHGARALTRGYLTRAQMIDAGYRDRDIKAALRIGLLVRLRHGISLVMMWRGGIPRPEQQVTIFGPLGVIARVDFDWEAWRHSGEFDGLFKYGRLNHYGVDPGRVLADEKTREDAVRGTGRGMSRWNWPELPLRQTAERVRRDLDRSRTLYRRGRTHIVLG